VITETNSPYPLQYDISRIAELSWDLLDRALSVSSREIMLKRSTEEKSKRKLFSSSRLLAEQRGGIPLVDHHKAFFHEDDVELRKRIKPSMSRIRSAS
jgi:hypothetical protein